MDRQIKDASLETGTKQNASNNSGHLMCRTPLWGLAGFLGCAYFTWISFAHVIHNELEWPHDYWTAVTYVVWIVLLGALALDTHCLRERVFFGVLVINFVVGCGLTLWRSISSSDVRVARSGTGALWALAALLSLTTLRNSREQ